MVKRIFNPFRLFFEIIGIFYDALQTLSYLGGGAMTAVSIVTFLQDIPIAIPIILLVLGLVVIGVGVFRSFLRYKIWIGLRETPELNDVLEKALEIHKCVDEIHKEVIKENNRKNIKTKTREEFALKFFNTFKLLM